MPAKTFYRILWCCLTAARAQAAVYEVGPGKTYSSIAQAPWTSLTRGDCVLIHWRDTPYREKWVIARQGAAEQPITIKGVPNRFGEIPIIDGSGAATPLTLNYWGEERGVIKIGGANTPTDTIPAHIVLENLEVRNARPQFRYVGDDQSTNSYAANAAAIYIEKGRNIVIRNCILRDCGNGLFAGPSYEGESSNLTVEGCWIYDNGNTNSAYEHNNYTEVNGILFQYNYFGPLRAGCSGNNLKDRSAGTVIRYNWIEGGNRQLDLVDSDVYSELPTYSNAWVYGNLLIESGDIGNSQILHYGGDSGDPASYRKGCLRFFNNTVISKRTGHTTLFRLSTGDETADCRNNIIFLTAVGDNLALLDETGTLDLSCNWFKTNWVNCHGTLLGTIHNLGGNIAGATPGFVAISSGDFHLTQNSPCVDQAANVPSALTRQYVKHQRSEPRKIQALGDMGAFEFTSPKGQADDLLFIHHSCGANWLNHSLDAALIAKDYVDERNDIYYGTDLPPDSGRPDSLGSTPGDSTDMNHWIRWFNDYFGKVKTWGCSNGTNRIVMFKSCYPNSDISSDGSEPEDPFSEEKTLANYQAVYRHPGGKGGVYTNDGYVYKPLEDVFASNPHLLFIPITAPPLTFSETTDPNAHRARLFNDWLKRDWLNSYNEAHPGLNNVAIFDWFDDLAYPDDHSQHPNRLREEYGGSTGDAHPNDLANAQSTRVFAQSQNNFIDQAWSAFMNQDADDDAIPDWWELSYFNTLTHMTDQTDADGDGCLDRQEYIAGTIPTNSSSRFRISSVAARPENQQAVLTWPGVANRIYSLCRAANLSPSLFVEVATNISAHPPLNTCTIAVDEAHSFYRLQVRMNQ